MEGLPLYRQEKQFNRMWLALSRQTIANWMILGVDLWLNVLYDRMHQLLLKLDILHAIILGFISITGVLELDWCQNNKINKKSPSRARRALKNLRFLFLICITHFNSCSTNAPVT